MRHPKQSGMTLVEMVITIAVISVLASVMMVGLRHAVHIARCTKCKETLRLWGTGLSTYTMYNDGFIPRRGQGVRELKNIERDSDWFNCLPEVMGHEPYRVLIEKKQCPQAGDNSIFVCPSADDPGGRYFLAYAMNMYLSPWIRPEPHNITEIPEPSHVVFMTEAPGPYSSVVPSSEAYSPVARHDGRANVLFLDCSVRSFSAEYLGLGVGDPKHRDVRWQTGTTGINQRPLK